MILSLDSNPRVSLVLREGNAGILDAQGRRQPGLESGRGGAKGIRGTGTACERPHGREEPAVFLVLDRPKANPARAQDPGTHAGACVVTGENQSRWTPLLINAADFECLRHHSVTLPHRNTSSVRELSPPALSRVPKTGLAPCGHTASASGPREQPSQKLLQAVDLTPIGGKPRLRDWPTSH